MFDIKTLGCLLGEAAAKIQDMEKELREAKARLTEVEHDRDAILRVHDVRLGDITRLDSENYRLREEKRVAVQEASRAKMAFRDDLMKEGVYLPGAVLGIPAKSGTPEDVERIRRQLAALATGSICPSKIKTVVILRGQRGIGLKEAKDLMDMSWPMGLDSEGSFLPDEIKDPLVKEFVGNPGS